MNFLTKSKSFIYLLITFSSFSVEGQISNFFLKGICPNKTVKELKIIRQNTRIDYETPTLLGLMSIDSNNRFQCSLKIDNPQYVDIVAGNTTWKMFLYPNGHQSFTFDEHNQLHFDGDSSQYSNCVNELQYYLSVKNIREPFFYKKITLENYLVKVDSFMNIKKSFLNNYEKKNNINLRSLTRTLNYQYAYLLYKPSSFDEVSLTDLPEFYRNFLSKLSYEDDILVDNFFYTSAVRDKFILLNTKIENVQYNFSKIYRDILTHTKGRTKDYLISALVALYVNNNINNVDHTPFTNAMKNITNIVKDSVFLSRIKNNYIKFLFIDKKLPINILNETLLIKYNKNEKITLSGLLSQYSNKSIYIDFWASWCAPCRIDIEESKKSKLYLNNNDIIVIYISIDSDYNSWKKATEEYNIQENQFLLEKGPKSVLSKFLSIYAIPRYIIFNSEHKLVNINAPRLNESAYQDLLQVLRSLRTKKVNYD